MPIQQQPNFTQRMHDQSRLPYHICAELIRTSRSKDYRKLGILAEKHLLTGDESESLKEYGLTVQDCFVDDLDAAGKDLVQAIFNAWNERLGTGMFNVR